MNSIGGVYRLDQAPVDRSVAEGMNDAAQVLSDCRRGAWFEESVGLIWVSSRVERCRTGIGPKNDRRGRCVAVFDGRVDNRKELVAQLRARGADDESSDVELTVAAYEAWGPDCASKLVGDFAFAVWDSMRQRLLCARDPLGVRTLYVLVRHDRLCFASQLRQLLVALPETPSFDLEFIADRLAHGVDRADAACTPYRGVSRLKPGHRLVAGAGQFRVERYWVWRTPGKGADRCCQGHIEQFRERFTEAVRCRMRGVGRVWSDLSGGLDSSSIVSVAAELNRPSRLPTVSVVFGESTWSDERSWAAAVARAHDVRPHYVDGDTYHTWSRLRAAVDYWEEPHAAAAFFSVHQQYGRLLAGAGTPILLTGIGAEVVVMNKRQVPVHLADLLRHGRVSRLIRELDTWQSVLKMPLSNLIWRYCLKPLLSRPLVSYDWIPQTHAWVEASFARRWDLSGRAREAGMPRSQRDAADQWQVEMIGRITGFLLRGYLEKACDIRYPFLHRPLVELALETPWNLKAVPGEPKALLRRAMVDLLPEEILRRTQNASTDHAVYAGLRKEWRELERLVASSMLVELGIVNRERLKNALHLARQGHAFNLSGLLSTLTMDAWMQNAVRKGDAAWVNPAA